jgi:hypothetical protein
VSQKKSPQIMKVKLIKAQENIHLDCISGESFPKVNSPAVKLRG